VGELWISAWLVRASKVEAEIPWGWRLMRIGPWAVAGAVLAHYAEGGTLSYNEAAVGILIRNGAALAITIPWIRVDSELSMIGGRRFWSIPKCMAQFSGAGDRIIAEGELGDKIEVKLKPSTFKLPLALPLALAQPAPEGVVRATGRLSGVARLGRAQWRLPGRLAKVVPRRPLFTFQVRSATLELGPGVH
jgi:hypothetical protein